MGFFSRDRAVTANTNEFASLAGVSKMEAKRMLLDMQKMQRTGLSELMVVGAATMRKVDEDPSIEIEDLYSYIDDLVFNQDVLTFSDGKPFNSGVVTPAEVERIATSSIRLFRKDYVKLVQQRMRAEQEAKSSN